MLKELNKLIQSYEKGAETVVYVLYGLPDSKDLIDFKDRNLMNVHDYSSLMAVINGGSYFNGITKDRCDVFLNTAGGCLVTGLEIIKNLKAKYREVNVIVPTMALSVGAIISLGADKLYVNKDAIISDFLTSVEPTQLQAIELSEKLTDLLNHGDVVPNSEVSKFIMVNALMNKVTNHESSHTFENFREVFPSFNVQCITELNNRYEDGFKGDCLMGLANQIHDEVQKLMKDNSMSKFNTFSTLENFSY